MNNVIENFFAAATSNRFAAEGAIMGVIAYTLGFFFVPKEFFAGDFAVIAKSAAVDAGVAEADMVAWIATNADSIAAAVLVVGDEHGPKEPNVHEKFLTRRVLNDGVTWKRAKKDMYEAIGSMT